MPAETFRSTGEAAEGTFLSVDPDTNVQTFVTVFAGLSGSNDEPQVVIQVFQTDAAGYLFWLLLGSGVMGAGLGSVAAGRL